MTRDVAGAKAFYETCIGWEMTAMPMGEQTYWIAKVGEQPVAGIMDISGDDFTDVPACWFPYLAVDDVDARLKQATDAGATIQRAPFDIPGVGRIAIIIDPTGVAMGWMTDCRRQRLRPHGSHP